MCLDFALQNKSLELVLILGFPISFFRVFSFFFKERLHSLNVILGPTRIRISLYCQNLRQKNKTKY